MRGDGAALAALLALCLVARALALPGLTVFRSFDSGSYAPGSGVATLSFTGHAPRPWGVPVLYALVGSDTARAVLQWLLGTAAWAVLVVGLWTTLRTLPARVAVAVALIALAITSAVTTWDFAILSESLSISLGVMAVGLAAVWLGTGSRAAAAGVAVVGIWWTFTRPDIALYVAALLVAVIVVAALRSDRRRTALAVAAALLLGLAWSGATLSRTDAAFREWGLHLGLSESTFVYRLRLQVYPDPQVREVYARELGMPSCPATAAFGRPGASSGSWEMERFVAAYRSCPALVSWVAREKSRAAVRYMLADPGHFARITRGSLAEMLGGAVYARRPRALPRVQDGLFFPRPTWALRGLLLAFVLALAAVAATGALRRSALAAAGGALVVVSGVSALVGTLYSAGEYPRFGIQEAILMRVGLIVMLAAALDAFVLGRRARRLPRAAGSD